MKTQSSCPSSVLLGLCIRVSVALWRGGKAQMDFGSTTNILYLLFTYYVLLNYAMITITPSTDERLRAASLCSQCFCKVVVWIAELVRLNQSSKLIEINLATLFQLS